MLVNAVVKMQWVAPHSLAQPDSLVQWRVWPTAYLAAVNGLSRLIRVPPMDDRAICLYIYTLGQKFCLDTPKTDSTLQKNLGYFNHI